MTDLAAGLSTADAAELTALAAAAETAYVEVARAEARYTAALAQLEQFAQARTAHLRVSKDTDLYRRTIASEVAAALRESDRAVQGRMSDAHTLVTGYPTVFGLWAEGRIGRTHVTAVTDAGRNLPADARTEFDRAAADICLRQSTVRARQTLHALAERTHPQSLTERHRDARKGRRVDVMLLGDGMSRLTADLPTIIAEGIRTRLDTMASLWADELAAAKGRVRDAQATGATVIAADAALAADDRTKDQARADTFADLLLTGAPDADPTDHGDGRGDFGAIRASVQVVVAATTLLGADELPADIAGVAPIDAATARELAGDCTGFDRVLVHPVTGQVLATDRYRPTLDLRRRLRARDRHCRFPGCRVPAIRCEADHTVDFALGGPTCLTNLAMLCQRHHTMKQFTPWRVHQLGDGRLEWSSPTGRVYIDEPPPPRVFFAPAPPPF